MKTSYEIFIKGRWQFGISGLKFARLTAQDLANHQYQSVDIYQRTGRSASSDEFVETVEPVGLAGLLK